MATLLTHICVTRPQWVKLKSRENSFVQNIRFCFPIVLKFCIPYCTSKPPIMRKAFLYHGASHYGDVIMGTIASQITSLTIVYSIVYSDADQRKHQSFASLALVRGIHQGPVNFPHKWPVTRKMFPFDDVIMGSWRHIHIPSLSRDCHQGGQNECSHCCRCDERKSEHALYMDWTGRPFETRLQNRKLFTHTHTYIYIRIYIYK